MLLYDGWFVYELVVWVIGEGLQDGYDIVCVFWVGEFGGCVLVSDEVWEWVLCEGVIEGMCVVVFNVKVSVFVLLLDEWWVMDSDVLELLLCFDLMIWDGCYVNNGWLQELFKLLIQFIWSNVVLISLQLVVYYGYVNGDVVWLCLGECELEVLVWIMLGQVVYSIMLYLGYGC